MPCPAVKQIPPHQPPVIQVEDEHEGKRHDDAPEIALERDLRLPPREEKGGAEQDTPSRDVYQLSQTFDRGRLWCVIHLIILFSATQI